MDRVKGAKQRLAAQEAVGLMTSQSQRTLKRIGVAPIVVYDRHP